MNSIARQREPSDWGDLPIHQVNHILRLQRDVLASVARKADATHTLELLCGALEALVPNAVASVMLLDPAGESLSVIAAPSIPADAIARLNGLRPAASAGSCGTAVFSGVPQYVENTLEDPRWSPPGMRQWALDFNVCACWSYPIEVEGDRVIGSVALSSFEHRAPEEFHRRLLETASQLAAIVIERQQEQEQLWRLAHHDHLTGLPNRVLLERQLQLAIARCRRQQGRLALLFLDLDHFKHINDAFGHHVGDLVLGKAAAAMAGCLRVDDLLARLGGDEFLILLANVDHLMDVPTVAEKLLERLAQPILVDGREHHLSASIGVSIYPEDGTDLETLQKHADIAMYEAKARGRGCFEYFQQELTRAVTARVEIAHALQGALARNEMQPYFQPQFAARSGRLEGVEVLARWQRPGLGPVSPDTFIPVAEETGLIGRLGEYLVAHACRHCVGWWAAGLPAFQLAINLSARQLRAGFTEGMLEIVDSTGFPRERLEFEITESMLMERGLESIAELHKLKEAGITISMDDFGTGHSSLSQLKHLPISKLKIDRSFVTDIPQDANDAIIARTVIAMGHALDLQVVAEGVESTAQHEFLRREGCDLLQGYLFCRPLPAAEFEVFLQGLLQGD